ncbi:MAG: PepSY-associated TM helix domain-containing protein, partial [Pseudomonadota bacterium]
MRRRAWFDWHSWIGLNLSLLMTFVVLTGTLATVSTELDWLANPAVRASAAPDGALPAGTMLSAFARAYPDADAVSMHFPSEGWLAPSVVGRDASGVRFRVFFDGDGRIQGTGAWNNWQRFFRETHRHLMLPLNIGLTVVSLLSIPLLVTFVSSLYVYRRWWRGFFRVPRRPEIPAAASTPDRKARRRYWGDLHRLVGVWSLWFVLLMGVTGTWYLVEHLGLKARLPALERPASGLGEETRLLVSQPGMLDTLIAEARTLHPQLVIRSILPGSGDGAILIRGQADTVLVRDRANQVAFDGVTGALRDVRHGAELDALNRVSEAADPLHFGNFGGPSTR